MIEVELRLYATLRRYQPGLEPGEALVLTSVEGRTLRHLLEEMGLPPEEVKIAIVNGLVRGMDYLLADGDRVGLFPPIGGG